jgi:outer membrane protein assembly factor BamD (BamD/ComL family)
VDAPAEPPSVSAEVALLQRAQRSLAAGDAAAALALLDRHQRRFPSGALVAERLAAQVFALCELGRVERARTLAQEFSRVAPNSPLVPRVAASCGGSGSPSGAGGR